MVKLVQCPHIALPKRKETKTNCCYFSVG